MARTLEEVNKEIQEVKDELANLKGTKTEVYARIVGYYRSVANWNKGKREEYNHRKLFSADENSVCSHLKNAVSEEAPKQEERQSSFAENDRDYTYEFFMRKTCPNCPPVKEYVAGLDITGTFVDVDTKEGLERATELGILAAPTVVVFDTDGKECFRARTVQDLRNFFESHLQAKAV